MDMVQAASFVDGFLTLLSLVILVTIIPLIGPLGENNSYRWAVFVLSLVMVAGYFTQIFVFGKPSHFMGFPTTGIFCYLMIAGFQLLAIQINNRKQASKRAEREKYDDQQI